MSSLLDSRVGETSGQRFRRRLGQPFIYLIALIVVGAMVAPVAYVMIGGFRSNLQITSDPAGLPDPWDFSNYITVLTSARFWGQAWSSTLAAVGTTLGVMILGVMAAFVIARYQFRGRQALYSLFTAGLMFPLTIAILPLSIMLRDLGLFGSVLGLIVPQVAFALPITVIILVPFLRAVPGELEDAAAIDGATKVGFFWRILLPLSGPGLITVGVLAFVGSWNAYLLPLFVLSAGGAHVNEYTLPLGVAQFSSQYSSDTAAILAFTSLAMIPALVFFLAMQNRIVSGLQGAVKG